MRIEVDVPDGASGGWRVERFAVTKEQAELENLRAAFSFSARAIAPGDYVRLMQGRTVVMSNTPAEIRDHLRFIHTAKRGGKILINGLGLGVALKEILASEAVESVTVVEKSADVINLVGPTFEGDPRVKIVHADAFDYRPPRGERYAAVWHDIWNDICADNLPEMHALHRKYGRRADWQGSWCRGLCERARQ